MGKDDTGRPTNILKFLKSCLGYKLESKNKPKALCLDTLKGKGLRLIDLLIAERIALSEDDFLMCAAIAEARSHWNRRRLMNRLLRYENHYSSGAEGYPPR